MSSAPHIHLWSLYEVEEEDPYKQISTQVEMNILVDRQDISMGQPIWASS